MWKDVVLKGICWQCALFVVKYENNRFFTHSISFIFSSCIAFLSSSSSVGGGKSSRIGFVSVWGEPQHSFLVGCFCGSKIRNRRFRSGIYISLSPTLGEGSHVKTSWYSALPLMEFYSLQLLVSEAFNVINVSRRNMLSIFFSCMHNEETGKRQTLWNSCLHFEAKHILRRCRLERKSFLISISNLSYFWEFSAEWKCVFMGKSEL